MSYSVGDTVTIDGIESLIIYDKGSETTWGRYILVDKNHDISYYLDGSDYKDESESGDVINSANKYGYEWGGRGIETGITTSSLGSGLTNTNSLIGMNLQPNTAGWYVVWDKVSEFRETYGSKWFVPSLDELNLVYENRDSLSGLTTTSNKDLNPYYWSSREYDSNRSYRRSFDSDGGPGYGSKNAHYLRVRLCRYATDSELPSKTTINITCSTENSSIYYTLNNTEPTESSTLYTTQFEVSEPCIIKAKAYRNGYLESDISVLDLNTGE